MGKSVTKEQIADIIFDEMIKQEVNHRPAIKYMNNTQRRLLFLYGGLLKACEEFGIKSKQEYYKLIVQGKERYELIQTKLRLIEEKKEIEEKRRMMRIY